jgi:hypothetical protein
MYSNCKNKLQSQKKTEENELTWAGIAAVAVAVAETKY